MMRIETTLAALALATNCALAQDARDGPMDMQLCFSGPMQAIDPVPGQRFGTYQVSGETRSADPQFDALKLECVGAFERRAETWQHKGYCVYTAANGSTLYGTDTIDAQGYRWSYYGGSGRYQGISGEGKIERVASTTPPAAPAVPGTMRGCRRLTGAWKLP